MNGRKKIEAAFSIEGTAAVPVVICYTDIFINDHWEELTNKPWWYKFSPDINQQLLWRKEVASVIDQDWFELPVAYPGNEAKYFSIIKNNKEIFIVDLRNNKKKKLERPSMEGKDIPVVRPYCTENSPHNLEEFDLWFNNFEENKKLNKLLQNDIYKLPNRIISSWGKTLFPIRDIPGPLWHCFVLWGFEKTMMWLIEKPEMIHYACKKFTEYALDLVILAKKIGTSGIWIVDCMTDMISPEHFKMFNTKYLRQITAEINSHNMYSIHNFCGNPKGKWDLLISSGANGLALEESKKNFKINIEEVVKIVNKRITIFGNLDAINILANGSKDNLSLEIRRQIEAGRKNGNRFIMSIGSPVTPGTKLSRVQEYIRMVRSLNSG